MYQNIYKTLRIPNVIIFDLAFVVVELFIILWFFTKEKLQNILGTHAATWQKKLAADLS